MSSAQTQQHQALPIKRTETVGARVEKYLQAESEHLTVAGVEVGAAVDILMQKLKDPSVAPLRLASAFEELSSIDRQATTQALLQQLAQCTGGSVADTDRFNERVRVLENVSGQAAEAALIQFIELYPDQFAISRDAARTLSQREQLSTKSAAQIMKLASMEDPSLKDFLLKALGHTNPPDTTVAEFLRRAAKSEPSWETQTTAAAAAMRQGDLSAIEYLEPVTKGQKFQYELAEAAWQSGDPQTQWRAFRAMTNAPDGGFNGVWLETFAKTPIPSDLKSAVLEAFCRNLDRENQPSFVWSAAARAYAQLSPDDARRLFAERSPTADSRAREAMASALLQASIRDVPPLLVGPALEIAMVYTPPQDKLDQFSLNDRQDHLMQERAKIVSELSHHSPSPAFGHAIWGQMALPEDDRRYAVRAVLDAAFLGSGGVASLASMLRSASASSPPHASEMERYAQSLEKSAKLGIEHPVRFTAEALDVLVSERETRKDLPRAVVIMPKSDWNGAFTNTEVVVNKLQASGYSVLVYEVGSDTEFAAALRDASTDRKIDALVIGGHGERGAVELRTTEPKDSRATLDLWDVTLLRSVAATMAEGSQVVLWSCSTGEGGATSSNMANLIRRVWPQVQPEGIFAPRVPTNIEELKIEKNRIWDVVYTDQPSEQPQAAPIKYQALSFPPLSMFGRARGA